MTKRELIEAFVRGEVDRRQFINRLTMLGVSGGAAVAYATTLGESAYASSAKPVSGFVMRAQATDDEDYGTAFFLELIEALQAVIVAITDLILVVLDGLAAFIAGDFAAGVFESLQTIEQQQQEHLDAATAMLTAAGGAAGGVGATRLGFQAQQFATSDELLATLADGFDQLTAMYAAVVPTITDTDGEVRQTLTEIASVASRHAAAVNIYAGRDPFPETFQTPALPAS